MKKFWVLIAVAALAGCGGGTAAPAEQAAHSHDEEAEHGAEPEVHVTAEMQQQWGISVGPAEKGSVTGAATLPGILTLNQDRTAEVSAIVAGKVKSIGAALGAPVRRNQALVTLHAPELAQAKIELLQGRARLDLASQEYERAQALMKLEAIEQKEYLRRKTDYETAVTDVAVAESTLHSMGLDQAAVDALLDGASKDGAAHLDHFADPDLHIVSPLDGRVVQRDVLIGQHVQPEMRLFTISDLSTLWAWLDAREADLPHVEVGRPVRIKTGVYPDRSWPGKVVYVGDVVDEKTRTVKLRVEVRNDGSLKPNMFIQGEIETAAGESGRQVLTVPEAAITSLQGNPVVFVREHADCFVPRPVELGERLGDRRIVLRGLDEAEQVVVAGVFKLKAELLKATIAGDEHGHNHGK